MKKGKYILSFILVLFLTGCTTSKQVIEDFNCSLIDYPVRDFKVDLFGSIYTIDFKNRLRLYDQNLNLQFEYYNNTLGDISYIDVTNPKKIAIFFDGFQKVVYVDDTLSELARYEGELNILAIGSSRDNNLWIYDGLDYRLKKISRNNKLLLESNPLESYHRLNIQPDYIIEHNNMVYLVEEGNGIAVFDNFGTFSNFIPGDISSVFLDKNRMYYMKQGAIYRLLLDNAFAEEREIKTVSLKVKTAYIFNQNIFYLENNCMKKTSID
ncbi:hypothetical protein [Portibacter marinus]|uniref:hypothetical protein n=1 Tax=Portibacter marinus TaxID=2898660 RepID=UPI001F42E4D4|nr:hypothetical protein [Portibacter marinus]